MAIASYAYKVFDVSAEKVFTFSDLQISSSLETEKQDNEGKKPSTYIKGSGLGSLSIQIKLDSALMTNPRSEFESWVKLKDSSTPYPFILNGVPIMYTKFLLIDVQLSDSHIDNLGNMLSATLALKFEEYVSAGKAPNKESNGSSTSAKSKGKKSKSSESTESVYDALSPSKKQQLK